MSTVAIIAGGRDLPHEQRYFDYLDQLHKIYNIVEVVDGCALGADRLGRVWAQRNNIKTSEFPAQWRTEGKSAGPIRNREMATYVSRFERKLCILFPGGAGTINMRNYARMFNVPIEEYR